MLFRSVSQSRYYIMRNNNSVGTENSLVIGTHNLTNYSSVEGNKVFVVGNGTSDTSKSDCFQLYTNGKVGIFNDILIKAGTLLKTVAQNVVGATNEIFDFAMPVYKGTTTLSFVAGERSKGIKIPHNLGYRPSRIETLFHGGDIIDWENPTAEPEYIYTSSYIYFAHDGDSVEIYTMTQTGVNSDNILIFLNRFSAEVNIARTYTIDYFLYK